MTDAEMQRFRREQMQTLMGYLTGAGADYLGARQLSPSNYWPGDVAPIKRVLGTDEVQQLRVPIPPLLQRPLPLSPQRIRELRESEELYQRFADRAAAEGFAPRVSWMLGME